MITLPLPKAANIDASEIILLCKKISPNTKPIYLPVEGMKDALLNECYGNVAKMIELKGGSIQYGWQIWETLAGVMAEAEFHAVWMDDQGIYHDVTPKAIAGINQILFLPDSHTRFENRQIDNIRISLRNDPLIHQFIEKAEEYFEVTNRGELAHQFGSIKTTPEMEDIFKKRCSLELAIIQKYYL